VFGPVGSVVLGGIGAIVVAGTWVWRFREMAQPDAQVRPA